MKRFHLLRHCAALLSTSNKRALGSSLGTVLTHTLGSDSVWTVTSQITGNGNRSFGLSSSFHGDTNFSSRGDQPRTCRRLSTLMGGPAVAAVPLTARFIPTKRHPGKRRPYHVSQSQASRFSSVTTNPQKT